MSILAHDDPIERDVPPDPHRENMTTYMCILLVHASSYIIIIMSFAVLSATPSTAGLSLDHHVVAKLHGAGPDPVAAARAAAPNRDAPQNFSMSVCQVFSRNMTPIDLRRPYSTVPASGAGRGSGFATQLLTTTTTTAGGPQGAASTVIVTNHHVVANTSDIVVTFPSTGAVEHRVRVLADAPSRDIAILQLIEPVAGLVPLQLHADRLVPGEGVVAVGYPLGMNGLKVTGGNFSGSQAMAGGHVFLQTSAPLCHGNSGGPLVSVTSGHVVGINASIIKGASNVGYSIPADTLRGVFHDYGVKGPAVPSAVAAKAPVVLSRPLLGAFFQRGTEEQSEFLGDTQTNRDGGAYVSYVMDGSLMHQGGLRRGMEVVSLGGQPVNRYGQTSVSWSPNPVHINAVLDRLQLGDKVDIGVVDHGTARNLDFVYRDCDPRQVKPVYAPYDRIDNVNIGGLSISQLTQNHLQPYLQANPCLAAYLDPDNLLRPALIITDVFAGSSMAKSRCMAPGMLLTHLNNHAVHTIEDVHTWFEQNAAVDHVEFHNSCHGDVVVRVSDMLANERTMAQRFNYPVATRILDALTAGRQAEQVNWVEEEDACCADCGAAPEDECVCVDVADLATALDNINNQDAEDAEDAEDIGATTDEAAEAEEEITAAVAKQMLGVTQLTDGELHHYLEGVQ